MPTILDYNSARIDVTEKIRQYYFVDESGSVDPAADLETLCKLFSEAMFYQPTNYAMVEHGKHAPVYAYYLTYKSRAQPTTFSVYQASNPSDWLAAEIKIAAQVIEDMADKFYYKIKGSYNWGVCKKNHIKLYGSFEN